MSRRRKIEAILAGGVLTYALANVLIHVVEKRKGISLDWDKALRGLTR